MKIAYLILAHDNPRHVTRLIKALTHANSHIFLHIDKKSKIGPLLPKIDNVSVVKDRVLVDWGYFSMVEATFNLLKSAVAFGHFDYYVLLSGSSYSLRSNGDILDFFENHRGDEFINLSKMPVSHKPLNRIEYFYAREGVLSHFFRHLKKIMQSCKIKRKFSGKYSWMKPYAGSQWWALSDSCVTYVLKFVQENPQFVNYFKTVWIPDEIFFQTIIGNSSFKERVKPNLVYVDWHPTKGTPAVLTKEHMGIINERPQSKHDNGQILFARKFQDDSDEIIGLIDAQKNAFWGMTAFFNPAGYRNKRENYLKFREASKRQGLNLLTVELSFDEKSFELQQGDADILIQLKGGPNNKVWQKEALLNVALRNLPKACDKIAWIDGDVIFKNNDWVKATSQLLNKYIVVHPYSHIFYLGQDQSDVEGLEAIPSGFQDGMRKPGIANGVVHGGVRVLAGYPGHWGSAWAARRAIFDELGFYERLILGSADLIMAYGFYGKLEGNKYLEMVLVNDALKRDCLDWMTAMHQRVNGSVFYVPGTIFHLWHGDIQDRNYKTRSLILKNHDFDPRVDLEKDEQGLLGWASDKLLLHQEVVNYFYQRNEDAAR